MVRDFEHKVSVLEEDRTKGVQKATGGCAADVLDRVFIGLTPRHTSPLLDAFERWRELLEVESKKTIQDEIERYKVRAIRPFAVVVARCGIVGLIVQSRRRPSRRGSDVTAVPHTRCAPRLSSGPTRVSRVFSTQWHCTVAPRQ